MKSLITPITAGLLLALSQPLLAATDTGGYAVTAGGNVTGAVSKTATSMQDIVDIIAAARLDANGKKVKGGAYPLVITYTGNEDSLINAAAANICGQWSKDARGVEIKEFTKGITIIGANGSSANFGIWIKKSSDVVVQNMRIGYLPGGAKDGDMVRVDDSPNVWVDHNELFAANHECDGTPDGDTTFEAAVDIKGASDYVTVSYNYIHGVKKVGLDGSSNSDTGRNITYHHNRYNDVNARLPLQRGGLVHAYNNLYSNVTSSGLNVRQNGQALIESNWFENAVNPVTSRYDGKNFGTWVLKNNNITKPADFSTYSITWTADTKAYVNADSWTSTGTFPTVAYSYSPVSAQCVKDNLANYAGVGKNLATLTSAACK
ncbi:pectate lyase PelC [Dickeya dadantii]|uniref:Pectate lyase B n=1 Tax=Dickeya dadantii (strain 3937) TaxID=198628 RepID=E0SJQ6_DICD3|nr:pectate lyase PelC [Dickeya dadantii]ADN00345.1 pectate lyase B [Dickeya dadantii 3937]MCL6407194.1 pectate lyase [Dickeya dadantii]NAT79610.1 pectate lyase [Dickeya dadantii]NPE52935.1 pectate lyase [Dickeya dadantii]NPE63423.1 polysaccharide lyase [Dickeya dadantii]